MQNEKSYDVAIDSLEKKVSANKAAILNFVKNRSENL